MRVGRLRFRIDPEDASFEVYDEGSGESQLVLVVPERSQAG